MNARKAIIYLVAAVIALNLALIAYAILDGSNRPRPMPNPNGYDDFVKAARMIENYNGSVTGSNQVQYADTMSRGELEALVATNEAALKLVEMGLSRECRVTMENSPNYGAILLPQIASIKSLEWLFVGAGRLAEMEGRSNDAANIYLDGIRFGQEQSRGGVMITKLVGIACENIATSWLSKMLYGLDAPKCREIAGALETIDKREESAETVLAQEKAWMREVFGIRGQISELVNYKSERAMKDRFIAKVQSTQARRRQMIIDFAARAYELEKGKPPQKVADLVPDYLKAVPKNPMTGNDMGLGR